jgi:hypothetical protein
MVLTTAVMLLYGLGSVVVAAVTAARTDRPVRLPALTPTVNVALAPGERVGTVKTVTPHVVVPPPALVTVKVGGM